MRIKVCGRHYTKDVNHHLIREACKFYDNLLFKSEEELDVSKSVLVKVHNVRNLIKDHDCDGFTHYTDGHIKPCNFIVEVDAHLSKTRMLRSLAHEFVHVWQFATGIKQWSLTGEGIRWYGQLVDPEAVDYYDHPWEIDAYGREVGLYRRFMDKDTEKSAPFDDLLKQL